MMLSHLDTRNLPGKFDHAPNSPGFAKSSKPERFGKLPGLDDLAKRNIPGREKIWLHKSSSPGGLA